MLENIKINPEFEHLIPPLVDDELELLEKNILAEGEIYTPIFVWNGFIIDGHHRYKILSKHPNIKFRIVEKDFENKYEAISWICVNQLGRRNLTPENKKYLVGKRYEAEKDIRGGDRKSETKKSKGQIDPLILKASHPAREKVAKETGTTPGYKNKEGSYGG